MSDLPVSAIFDLRLKTTEQVEVRRACAFDTVAHLDAADRSDCAVIKPTRAMVRFPSRLVIGIRTT